MCQIIVRKYRNNHIEKEQLREDLYLRNWMFILSKKGGLINGDEGYSLFFSIKYKSRLRENKIIVVRKNKLINLNDALIECESLIDDESIESFVFGLFSRQQPEMENASEVKISPYFSNYCGSDIFYFVHGTISNDKSFGRNLSVDTEIFDNITKNELEKLEGLYSYITVDETHDIKMIDKGMGFYKGIYKGIETYSTTSVERFDDSEDFGEIPIMLTNDFIKTETGVVPKPIMLKIAFSGGMDASLNTYKILKDISVYGTIFDLELVYFNFGARATVEELNACEKFINLLKQDFENNSIRLTIHDVQDIFNTISEISNEKSKLMDEKAIGNSDEAETTSAYVPFRNSIFSEILAAKAQKEFNEDSFSKSIFIGLGLNLSDGQVYGDNNVAWLEHMEKVLTYGGKGFYNIKMVSPYINKTKTNMLKLFEQEMGSDKLLEVLDISFSCYYPEDGKPCGKCGSCLLRNKAFNKAILESEIEELNE